MCAKEVTVVKRKCIFALQKIYFKLFYFILGNSTKRINRFFAHMITILSLFLLPSMYLYALVQSFTRGIVFHSEDLVFLIGWPLGIALFPLGAKLLIYIDRQ